MKADARALSRAATEAVLDVPGVRSVIPPGPSLAVLLRDVRSVLDLPRDGGAVLVDEQAGGLRVRVVVAVDAGTSATRSAKALRDVIVRRVEDVAGRRPTTVTVRVVEIV